MLLPTELETTRQAVSRAASTLDALLCVQDMDPGLRQALALLDDLSQQHRGDGVLVEDLAAVRRAVQDVSESRVRSAAELLVPLVSLLRNSLGAALTHEAPTRPMERDCDLVVIAQAAGVLVGNARNEADPVPQPGRPIRFLRVVDGRTEKT